MADSEKPKADPALEELNDPGSEVFGFSAAQLRKRIEIFDGNVKFHQDERAMQQFAKINHHTHKKYQFEIGATAS